METSGVNVIVSNNPTRQVVGVDKVVHHFTGFWYHTAFLLMFSGLILAIVAILKDDLTKLTFHSSQGSYVEYCGWHNLHSDTSTSYTGGTYSFSYTKQCGAMDKACTLEKIGTIWYALLIIGIIFGGLSLIVFILDCSVVIARLLIILYNSVFFGCMLACALTWGLYKTCHNMCNSFEFPNLSDENVYGCTPKWGISWILVIIAGGLALLSLLSLMMSRSVANKYY